MNPFRNSGMLLVGAACLGLWQLQARADDKPLRQIIDAEIRIGYEKEKLTPAADAGDAVFLRRVYLDLVGTIPTYEEVKQFLEDKSEDKRAKVIDKLLDDPRYPAQQARHYDLILFGRKPPDNELTMRREALQKWLRDKFAKNEPYNIWARELLLSDGATYDGPAMFYAQYRSRPEDTAEAVSRIFLGTQIHCARCHDHPFDKWKQTDFYGMAGFFVRLNYVETNKDGKRHYILAEKSSGEVLFTGPASQQTPGKKGDPVPARFLGGDLLEEPPLPRDFKEPDMKGNKNPPKPLFSRKEKFADWVTKPENPYFTKAIVNRIWAQFMGRGLADPVDNIRLDHPVGLAALLEALEKELIAHNYDLKWLIRELVNSQTYQMSSKGESVEALPRWYDRARVRPLTAEEIMVSWRAATGFDAALQASGGKPEATKIPDEPYFMMYYGEPTNGRGEFQPGLNEHLFMNNSGNLRQSMIQPKKGNLADSIVTSQAPWEERVERIFMTVLSRMPTERERKKFVDYLTAEQNAAPAVEEVIWVLLNTAEFRFNH
ncbi:hypothetical protein AYO44_09080 [Planctomycetaceae bacterium SCGC AG-212-F19]|nr:hypothetical protein AYO44_09080 [Planctomycetaceae bacterium SCGC AG-212-F19]